MARLQKIRLPRRLTRIKEKEKAPAELSISRKLLSFPAIGDESENLHIRTYTEFNMTTDSDLFNAEGKGWPLYQGKTIHHFTNHFIPVENWVVSSDGEERLSKKKRLAKEDLPDRSYRIIWRNIASATNERTLIPTVVPPFIFTAHSLNCIELRLNEKRCADPILLSGINTILSSCVCDFTMRKRISMNVSATFVKELPVPRDITCIRELGEEAMSLYAGEDMEGFRGDVPKLTDPKERKKLQAKLDARTAILYGLTFEEYQTVLSSFPLMDESYKDRCLRWYNRLV